MVSGVLFFKRGIATALVLLPVMVFAEHRGEVDRGHVGSAPAPSAQWSSRQVHSNVQPNVQHYDRYDHHDDHHPYKNYYYNNYYYNPAPVAAPGYYYNPPPAVDYNNPPLAYNAYYADPYYYNAYPTGYYVTPTRHVGAGLYLKIGN